MAHVRMLVCVRQYAHVCCTLSAWVCVSVCVCVCLQVRVSCCVRLRVPSLQHACVHVSAYHMSMCTCVSLAA